MKKPRPKKTKLTLEDLQKAMQEVYDRGAEVTYYPIHPKDLPYFQDPPLD